MINVAIMGFGTVGSGIAEILDKNSEAISVRLSQSIKLKTILDIKELSESPYSHLLTKSFGDIVNDESIEIVAETIGGLEPAYTFTKELLKSGRHVVTSNKELVSEKGSELFDLARKNNVNYLFEASVAGGIPVIDTLVNSMSANEITEIAGIVNGTTNFILTKMIGEGRAFDDVLYEAKAMGYAESNPEADVEGVDAGRKIAILSSLIAGQEVRTESIDIEGITDITPEDVKYAEYFDSVIKLIGHCKKHGENMYARVSPMIVSKKHMLSKVDGVYNGVVLKGNAVDDIMLYGKGAGKFATASAVTSDIIQCAKNGDKNILMGWSEAKDSVVDSKNEVEYDYLVRISYKNSETLKGIDCLKNTKVFIDNIVKNETAVIMEKIKGSKINEILEEIKKVDSVVGVSKICFLDY